MAHLAHKKLAEAGPPPPVLPAHLHSKTGGAAVQSWPDDRKDTGPSIALLCLRRFPACCSLGRAPCTTGQQLLCCLQASLCRSRCRHTAGSSARSGRRPTGMASSLAATGTASTGPTASSGSYSSSRTPQWRCRRRRGPGVSAWCLLPAQLHVSVAVAVLRFLPLLLSTSDRSAAWLATVVHRASAPLLCRSIRHVMHGLGTTAMQLATQAVGGASCGRGAASVSWLWY